MPPPPPVTFKRLLHLQLSIPKTEKVDTPRSPFCMTLCIDGSLCSKIVFAYVRCNLKAQFWHTKKVCKSDLSIIFHPFQWDPLRET